MVIALSAVLIAGCLLAAGWTVALAARDRRTTNGLLIVLAAVEVLILVQLLIAVLAVARGDRPEDTATFLSYAISEIVLVPAGVFWSQVERSRSSTLVIAVACLGVAVMTGRMLQIWSTLNG